MSIRRNLLPLIEKRIGEQKVLLLYGSRRVGKTALLQQLYKKYEKEALLLNAEDMEVQERLTRRTAANYKKLAGSKSLLLIDEAQHIPSAGQALKLLIDTVPGITVIASGSSSLDLINKTGEPLVGRSYTYHLFPIAQCELNMDVLSATASLDERLIYGSYPELWQLPDETDKAAYLKELVQGYLLKDIFMYSEIRNSDKIFQLLKLLAYQAGNEVSLNELGSQLGINKATVERYLDLLTKVFIIFPLGGYGANLRKEVVKSRKWYFFDNGIRNAIINNFSPLQSRNDAGQLWEQYIISERQKYNGYRQHAASYFFWRTYDQQEIDLIELQNDTLQAFEIKWGKAKGKAPLGFTKNYPAASFTLVNKENYLEWIT